MDKYTEIKQKLRAAAQNAGETFVTGTVVSTDGETCTVKVGEMVLSEVRCGAVTDGNALNLHIYPTTGSAVLMADLSNGEKRDMAVIAYSRTDKIETGTAEHTTANADTLKTQLEKMKKRVDGIIDAINNAVPVAQDGGAALQASMKAALAQLTDKEDFSEIEDPSLKHG